MSTLPNLLRSLLLTCIFSFLAPVFLVGLLLASFVLIRYLPPLEAIGTGGVEQLSHFLQIFGSGSTLQGLTVIGLVCSVVGVLFDTYTFYRLQNLRDH
ncbi:MAG: hypothetical protein IGS50_02305 [Synechococcales cyanobacterium C42_A2020_086]|jgi:hypothetical protein|nr:hypothetical protein [Synechococcales cyanobacterium M58_A2018_015]MBF2072585.1 hypothetical protein [Synechococcales cyanobacterium C42_A2020_086]